MVDRRSNPSITSTAAEGNRLLKPIGGFPHSNVFMRFSGMFLSVTTDCSSEVCFFVPEKTSSCERL